MYFKIRNLISYTILVDIYIESLDQEDNSILSNKVCLCV